MAQTVRSIPANYPQPLGTQILKADAQRQMSMLRQEIVTDLLGVLAETREPSVRGRLIKLIEGHLRAGIVSAERAEELWPTLEEAKQTIESRPETKPATARKQTKLFEQYDRVQRRSLALLSDSFENIRVILDRVQPPDSGLPQPASPNLKQSK